jgi:prepilin-type N-terminal cleavage/methylation domain-containing protein
MGCLKSKRRGAGEAGLTLVELVIAISIIALTLAFAGPSLQQYMKAQSVKATAKKIYSNLQVARLTAIRENRSIRVTLTATAGTESMAIVGDAAGDPIMPPMNFYSSPDSRGVRLTVPNPVVVFTPSGALQGFGQTLAIFHEDVQININYAITINAAGGFRLGKV